MWWSACGIYLRSGAAMQLQVSAENLTQSVRRPCFTARGRSQTPLRSTWSGPTVFWLINASVLWLADLDCQKKNVFTEHFLKKFLINSFSQFYFFFFKSWKRNCCRIPMLFPCQKHDFIHFVILCIFLTEYNEGFRGKNVSQNSQKKIVDAKFKSSS